MVSLVVNRFPATHVEDPLMDEMNPEAIRYLNELYRCTEGKTGAQASMFEVGAAIGLEKEAARRLAEDLIAEGLLEIKTLSGGISITAEGIDLARPDEIGGALPALGDGPLVDDGGRQALESIISGIKKSLSSGPTPYAQLEEMVLDIKTIDIQLLSPRPKTAVIKAVLHSLKEGLQSIGSADLAGQVQKMIGK